MSKISNRVDADNQILLHIPVQATFDITQAVKLCDQAWSSLNHFRPSLVAEVQDIKEYRYWLTRWSAITDILESIGYHWVSPQRRGLS